jgi:HlyD family secretion protein
MERKVSQIELLDEKSELVQEVLQRNPSWIIRHGNLILLTVVIGIFSLTSFVRYPDVINSNVILTSVPAPIHLVAKESGQIHFFVTDKAHVLKDEVICYIKTNVDFTEVVSLKKMLHENEEDIFNMSDNLEYTGLGLILSNHLEFNEALKAYHSNEILNPITNELKVIDLQIKNHTYLNDILVQKTETRQKQYDLLNKDYVRDRKLFSERVIAEKNFEDKERELLHAKSLLEDAKLEKSRNDIILSGLKGDFIRITNQEKENTRKLRDAVLMSHKKLKGAINTWEEKFLVKSPIDGLVSLHQFREDNQFIASGNDLATIIPNEDTSIICRAEIPVYNSGKIKIGQRVIIQLDNFPYEEFGVLNGVVESISSVPRNGLLLNTIRLEGGMVTSYGKLLPFQNEMLGRAEIVTEDMSLTERFLYQIIKPFKSR